MTQAIFHHVTLYWGYRIQKTPKIKTLYMKNVHVLILLVTHKF